MNHVSLIDAMIAVIFFKPALAPKEGFRKAPVLGKLAVILDCIFMPRGNSPEVK